MLGSQTRRVWRGREEVPGGTGDGIPRDITVDLMQTRILRLGRRKSIACGPEDCDHSYIFVFCLLPGRCDWKLGGFIGRLCCGGEHVFVKVDRPVHACCTL